MKLNWRFVNGKRYVADLPDGRVATIDDMRASPLTGTRLAGTRMWHWHIWKDGTVIKAGSSITEEQAMQDVEIVVT